MLKQGLKAFRFGALFMAAAWLIVMVSLLSNPVKAVSNDNFYGMHVGYDAYPPKSVPALKDLNVTWTRVWTNMDWDDRTVPQSFELARDLKAAGFKVIMVFHQPRVPTYQEARNYFDWAQTVPGMQETIDVWEILNELNLPKYWEGTAEQYVNQVLKAAWDSLHPNGELILGGAFTAYQNRGNTRLGTAVTEAYIQAGYLNYVDYAGSHPYTKTVKELRQHLDTVKSLFGSTPIILSEWNFKTQADWNQWARMLDEVQPYIAERVSIACYYRLLRLPTEGGWPGIFASDPNLDRYIPVEPFYSLYKSWSS
jgi:hypothetical protein